MTETYIKPGDYFENCGFAPALCLSIELDDKGELDTVHGISLVTGKFCTCSVGGCAPRKVTFEAARKMRLLGQDVDYIKAVESPSVDTWKAEHRWWEQDGCSEFAKDIGI